jgi:hypothetical protein
MNKQNITNEIKDRILNESINSRIEEITGKIMSKINEFGGSPQISNQPTDMTEKLHGGQKKIDVAAPKGKITKADFEKLRKSKKMETDEGNAFTGELAKAKKAGKSSFMFDGKKYPVKESKKTEYILSEDKLIDLIERVILEQNKAKGLAATEKVLRADKNINSKALKDVNKKMKDYLKPMTKGSYETNPDFYPKTNSDFNKTEKKAYKASDAVEEYIENFAYAPGMENLQYDEIAPNEKWLEKTIEGDSTTGNNPKWANAVDTGLGKKINAKRKKNLYGQEKNRSYNRVKQPVDVAGESKGSKSLDKMFKKLNTESKDAVKLNEEFNKISNLINYDTKTQ